MERNCFLVDLMLMRLGRWLRLLGQDAANPKEIRDEALLARAREESRTIITRDKRLFRACRVADVPCILIRSSEISDQLLEMAKEGVPMRLDPQRCTLCNGHLLEIEIPDEVAAQIEGLLARLWWCGQCQKLYWEGGHWKRMERMLDEICTRKDLAS